MPWCGLLGVQLEWEHLGSLVLRFCFRKAMSLRDSRRHRDWR